MSQDLTETLAKLSDRNLPKEEAGALLASLKDKDLHLEMEFQRHNTTLSISAPDAYRGGQTLNGKAGQREVRVLIPETDEQATRALAYGTSLSLTVRYLEFDDFYRRVTFTGSLQDKAEKGEPVPSPEPAASEPEELSSPEPEPAPEPVAEPQPEPVTIDPALEKVESQTGELAVFANPNLPASAGSSLAGKSSVRSSDLIATLAQQTQSTNEEAALVVDGFWDYLADVKGHYREHSPENHTLVIPHFGTFRFLFKSWNKRTFDFLPGPYDTGSRGIPSSSWVDQWSGEPGGLSVRRRISVFVAEQSGLPLKKADTLLNQLLDAVKGLFRGGATINWARRGTMRRITTRKGKEIYSFSPSPGFLERLQIPPAPKYYTPEPEQSRSPDHTEYEPEHTWEESAPKKESDWTRHTEGEGPQSGSGKSGKPPMPAGQKSTMKASGCGCITLPIIAAAIGSGQLFKLGFFLGIVFVVLMIKRGLCHKG